MPVRAKVIAIVDDVYTRYPEVIYDKIVVISDGSTHLIDEVFAVSQLTGCLPNPRHQFACRLLGEILSQECSIFGTHHIQQYVKVRLGSPLM